MPQIPEEAIRSIKAGRRASYVTFPTMSKEAAKKFCKKQGWVFMDKSFISGDKYFIGLDPKADEVMLQVNNTLSAFYSR